MPITCPPPGIPHIEEATPTLIALPSALISQPMYAPIPSRMRLNAELVLQGGVHPSKNGATSPVVCLNTFCVQSSLLMMQQHSRITVYLGCLIPWFLWHTCSKNLPHPGRLHLLQVPVWQVQVQCAISAPSGRPVSSLQVRKVEATPKMKS